MKTQARFTGKWVVEVTVEPGSVPDRAVPHSRNNARYRPVRLTMEFTTSATHDDPRKLEIEAGSGIMRSARQDIHLSGATIYGHRLKKDGTPGQQVTDEKFRGHTAGALDWAAEAVRIALEAIKGTAS